jgi:hypothetical protein
MIRFLNYLTLDTVFNLRNTWLKIFCQILKTSLVNFNNSSVHVVSLSLTLFELQSITGLILCKIIAKVNSSVFVGNLL